MSFVSSASRSWLIAMPSLCKSAAFLVVVVRVVNVVKVVVVDVLEVNVVVVDVLVVKYVVVEVLLDVLLDVLLVLEVLVLDEVLGSIGGTTVKLPLYCTESIKSSLCSQFVGSAIRCSKTS